jgi:hypothetical protein
MPLFLRIFGAVAWRSIVILILGAITFYGLSLVHELFAQSVLSIKLRLSFSLLPAGVIFLILAMRGLKNRYLLLEQHSPMSRLQWQQTYFALAACAFILVTIELIGALALDTGAWFLLRLVLPLPLFLLFWIGISVWQMKASSRKG